MFICEKEISTQQLSEIAGRCFGDMVKGVVDVKRELLALDAELHADLEDYLLENGSAQTDLWGINLYPEETDGFIEYDSLINIRPMHGNRTRGVDDPCIRKKIEEVVAKWTRR